MPYPVQERIRARCNERIVEDKRAAVHIILPGPCKLDLDAATVRAAVRQVDDWPALALDLNRWLVGLDQKVVSVDGISRRALALKVALAREDS